MKASSPSRILLVKATPTAAPKRVVSFKAEEDQEEKSQEDALHQDHDDELVARTGYGQHQQGQHDDHWQFALPMEDDDDWQHFPHIQEREQAQPLLLQSRHDQNHCPHRNNETEGVVVVVPISPYPYAQSGDDTAMPCPPLATTTTSSFHSAVSITKM
jgi:hypothetical protein